VKLFQSIPICVITVPVPERHRQRDGQTDNILWHNGALRRPSIARYK